MCDKARGESQNKHAGYRFVALAPYARLANTQDASLAGPSVPAKRSNLSPTPWSPLPPCYSLFPLSLPSRH